MLWVALLILFFVGTGQCSALFLISATTYPTCFEIPSGQSEVVLLPDGSTVDATSTANTLCGVMGAENTGRPVTAIRLRINQGRNDFSDILRIELTSVPEPGKTIEYNDDIPDSSFDCKDTDTGSDCTILQKSLLLTFKSTKLYAKYPMTVAPINFFYGVNIAYQKNYESCCGKDENTCCISPANYGADWKVSTNDVFAGNGGCYAYLKEQTSAKPLKMLSSTQGVNGLNSCPTLKQLKDSVSIPNTSPISFDKLYVGPEDGIRECGSFFCKIPKTPTGTSDTWNVQNEYYLGPTCRVGTMATNPIAEQRIRLTFSRDGTTLPLDYIDLYSGDGDFLRGTRFGNFPSSAKILNIDTPTNVIGYSRLGQILLCGSDSNDRPNMGTAQTTNYVDDMPPRNGDKTGDPSDLLYNPWIDVNLNAAGISNNLEKKCTVPLPACRELFLKGSVGYGNMTSFGYWAYIDEASRRFWNNAGCNQNVNQALVLNSIGIIGRKCYAMATTTSGGEQGLSGECIPGFEQIADATAFTACQMFGDLAKFAAGVVSSNDRSNPNFQKADNPKLTFMSPTYNPILPSEWVVPNGYMTETLDSGSATTEILIYLPASQVGVVVPVPTGEFSDAGMLCGATQAGPGAITYAARSRGKLPGVVYVVFTWSISDTESQAIISPGIPARSFNNRTNVYYQEISLPLNRATVYNTFNFEFSGSLWLSLAFNLKMYSVAPGGGSISLSDEITVKCTITEGVVQETVKSVIDNYNPTSEDREFCRWYNVRTFHCWSIFERAVWGQFYNLALLWPAIVISLITIILFFICTCKSTSKLNKQTAPKENIQFDEE